ncbi:MAG: type II toxin-antitoxin system VapC family toxin [Planctomycetes bacterium]|nr:type II toxin-antitoxin system VapC family toxin [Planctomycetota bacterium]
MYLLDTDMLSYVHAGHPRVRERFDRTHKSSTVAVTVVTKAESLRARYDYLLKASNAEQLLRAQELLYISERLFDDLPIVPMDEVSVAEFEKLQKRKGLKKIGRADLLIASIALSRQATLVTRNLKHFRKVPNLRLENWMD